MTMAPERSRHTGFAASAMTDRRTLSWSYDVLPATIPDVRAADKRKSKALQRHRPRVSFSWGFKYFSNPGYIGWPCFKTSTLL